MVARKGWATRANPLHGSSSWAPSSRIVASWTLQKDVRSALPTDPRNALVIQSFPETTNLPFTQSEKTLRKKIPQVVHLYLVTEIVPGHMEKWPLTASLDVEFRICSRAGGPESRLGQTKKVIR